MTILVSKTIRGWKFRRFQLLQSSANCSETFIVYWYIVDA